MGNLSHPNANAGTTDMIVMSIDVKGRFPSEKTQLYTNQKILCERVI